MTAKENGSANSSDWGGFTDKNRQTGGGGTNPIPFRAAPELKHGFNPL
jgi:hypothetical protein